MIWFTYPSSWVYIVSRCSTPHEHSWNDVQKRTMAEEAFLLPSFSLSTGIMACCSSIRNGGLAVAILWIHNSCSLKRFVYRLITFLHFNAFYNVVMLCGNCLPLCQCYDCIFSSCWYLWKVAPAGMRCCKPWIWLFFLHCVLWHCGACTSGCSLASVFVDACHVFVSMLAGVGSRFSTFSETAILLRVPVAKRCHRTTVSEWWLAVKHSYAKSMTTMAGPAEFSSLLRLLRDRPNVYNLK